LIIDGAADQRACLAPAVDGMDVQSTLEVSPVADD
jgi:hypothetical protein